MSPLEQLRDMAARAAVLTVFALAAAVTAALIASRA